MISLHRIWTQTVRYYAKGSWPYSTKWITKCTTFQSILNMSIKNDIINKKEKIRNILFINKYCQLLVNYIFDRKTTFEIALCKYL